MEDEKCLVELDEILNHLSLYDFKKIPQDIRESIRDKKDKNYIWQYDESKDLKEQNLNRKTIAMLSYLNMEYLLDDEQRKLMEQIHDLNEQKQEKEKQEKYNVDDLFKNNNAIHVDTALVEVKKERWYSKIVKFIKKIFS